VPRAFDLSHVEPAHFAAALGNDPTRIFNYVRDEIAFEAYRGALRGPCGTLLAMAGNAVDRAALLASLLTSAGQRVRFVHGTLPEAAAEQLVASIWAERPWLASGAADLAPTDVKAARERLLTGIQRDATLLRDTLKRAGHPGGGEATVTQQSLVKAAQDHYWLEWSQAGETWTAMDPSFATAAPGQVFAKPVETLDTLPDAIFHRVEVRVRVEEYTGNTPSSRDLLNYAAKAADLSGIDVFIAHESQQGSEANHVRPFLSVRQQRITGTWFSLTSPPIAAPTATAESIELTFIAPGGSRETVVRDIFDRVGRKQRRAGQSLTTDQLAAATKGIVPADFTAGLYDLFFTTGAIDAAHLAGIAADPTPSAQDARFDAAAGLRRVGIAYTAVSDALSGRIGAESGAVGRFYLDTPRVDIAELSSQGEAFRLGLDLRKDRARAVVTGFRREHLFNAQLLRGVINGTLERIVAGFAPANGNGLSSDTVFSTSLLFEMAHAQKTPIVLLARDSSAWRSVVPDEGRARIDESLAAGNIVVVPEQPFQIGGAQRTAWWEIEPRSGVTTAVTDEGLHQAVVEGTIVRADNRTYVFFRTSSGWSRPYVFNNANQANNFVNGMQYRFAKAGLETIWRAILY